MKKLNKLQIKSEKLMKNEDLITLRGGYDGNCCECHVVGGSTYYIQSTPTACNSDCYAQYGGWGVWQCII
jgi:hypothetical protein